MGRFEGHTPLFPSPLDPLGKEEERKEGRKREHHQHDGPAAGAQATLMPAAQAPEAHLGADPLVHPHFSVDSC